jgi:osmotically-inducible protein OsmY
MSDDGKLRQAVLDALDWEPSVNAALIGVTAKAGVVTLMGHVESYVEKFAAEKATRRVKNVKAIAEEIQVALPIGIKRADDDIAAAVVNRLAWNSSIPKDSIAVRVEGGWVTLTGEVEWHYQQDAAEDEVSGLWGVTGVSNQIAVKPMPNTSKIRSDILVALDRAWFDPATIDVAAQGGNVRLTGTVASWHEREEASSAAWSAPGTTSVENDITVV